MASVDGIFIPKGLPSGLHLVSGDGRVPCWKYARAALAVQRDGEDHEVCYNSISTCSIQDEQ